MLVFKQFFKECCSIDVYYNKDGETPIIRKIYLEKPLF
jgi:hypothetical protein